MRDDMLESAVSQLSLVSQAMKMLLETCERELLAAADAADPGPGTQKTMPWGRMGPEWAVQGTGLGGGRQRRTRLRAR